MLNITTGSLSSSWYVPEPDRGFANRKREPNRPSSVAISSLARYFHRIHVERLVTWINNTGGKGYRRNRKRCWSPASFHGRPLTIYRRGCAPRTSELLLPRRSCRSRLSADRSRLAPNGWTPFSSASCVTTPPLSPVQPFDQSNRSPIAFIQTWSDVHQPMERNVNFPIFFHHPLSRVNSSPVYVLNVGRSV